MPERLVSGVWLSEVRRGMEVVLDHWDRGCVAMADERSGLERRLGDTEAYARYRGYHGIAEVISEAAEAIREMRRAMDGVEQMEAVLASSDDPPVVKLKTKYEYCVGMETCWYTSDDEFRARSSCRDWRMKGKPVELRRRPVGDWEVVDHATPSSFPPVATASPATAPVEPRVS